MIRVGRVEQMKMKMEGIGTYHLFEVCKTEDRIVDLDRFVCGYVGHGFGLLEDGYRDRIGFKT